MRPSLVRLSSFFASVSWGLDALLALAVSAPVVAALRAQWPHLGADALLAPGGTELLESLAQKGVVFSSAALAFVILAVLRWAFALGVDVWYAQALGATRRGKSLVFHMLGVRAVGAIPTGVFLAAAASPLYAIRDVPFGGLSTRGNIILACGMAIPSLSLAVLAMGAERLARAYVASAGESFNTACLRAAESVRGGLSPTLRGAIVAVLVTLGFGLAAAPVAKLGYGVGVLLSQSLLFVAAWLRAHAFGAAANEALSKHV
jgi:hypothetical protein